MTETAGEERKEENKDDVGTTVPVAITAPQQHPIDKTREAPTM